MEAESIENMGAFPGTEMMTQPLETFRLASWQMTLISQTMDNSRDFVNYEKNNVCFFFTA